MKWIFFVVSCLYWSSSVNAQFYTHPPLSVRKLRGASNNTHKEDENDGQNPWDNTVICSVLEYPTEAHLCSAVFISVKALLTTARCIYGRQPHKTYVHALSEFLLQNGKVAAVEKLIPHPDFEAAPSENDMGVIIVKSGIDRPVIFGLPWDDIVSSDATLLVYSWKFQEYNKQSYKVIVKPGKIISNVKCSLILHDDVTCQEVCVESEKGLLELGTYDEGIPLGILLNNEFTVIGIYGRKNLLQQLKAMRYNNVFNNAYWIRSVIKNMSSSLGNHRIDPLEKLH